MESDVQEVTSFAYYVQNFFSNIFACCGGCGGAQPVGSDQNSNQLRHSLNSSMHSNVLQYSFVAVPNHNSTSQESGEGKGRRIKNGKAAVGKADQEQAVRRSQLLKNYKRKQESGKKIQEFNDESQNKEASLLDEEVILGGIAVNGVIPENQDVDDGESDIIDPDDDMSAKAQRPM